MTDNKTRAKHTSRQVAGYFLRKAMEEGKALDRLKLIKLVYIAHGWHLGIFGTPLIKEYIEAWIYGPVMRELYFEIKKLSTRNVPNTHFEADCQEAKWTDETEEFLDAVWARYKGFSGIQLSNICHAEGTPWSLVKDTEAIIPDKLILKHYKRFWDDQRKGTESQHAG